MGGVKAYAYYYRHIYSVYNVYLLREYPSIRPNPCINSTFVDKLKDAQAAAAVGWGGGPGGGGGGGGGPDRSPDT